MTKLIKTMLLISLCLMATDSLARGGFSGGGRGGFSSGRSFSSPSRSYSSPRSTTTRMVTTSRSSSFGRSGGYYGGMGYHPMMYPGFGMGYGYYGGNGLLTGLIIGSMMHPQGTTVYSGGGYSGGSALLYPDGKVVDQNGYQVGTYINGQFTAMQGGMVAQPAPANAMQEMQAQAQPVVIQEDTSAGTIIAIVVITVLVIAIFAAML